METILKFAVNETFKKIIAHSKAAVKHEPNFEQRCDRQYVKDGVRGNKDYYDDSELDYTKIPAGFWLVKDEGVYIMSNGTPRMTGENVVYAEGYGKDAEYVIVHEAVGGDDFCIFLPLSWMRQALIKTSKIMTIKFTKKNLELVL